MLTITHTHAEGTLITGTTKGDGTAEVLKSTGWRWGRSIATWYLPHTRDRLPSAWKINRTTKALREAGYTVDLEVDTQYRSTAEVEAGKIARQADRVEALEAKADRKGAADDAAWDAARGAFDRLPDNGQPILIGHHSEGRHRNAIAKADNAMRRSIAATADAEDARGRADAAASTTDARYSPVTVANRIKRLGAELRKLERQIYKNRYDAERGYVPPTEEQKAATAQRLAPAIAEKRDQIAYWEGVRAAQVESGQATAYSRDNVAVGDQVKIRGHWSTVARCNPTTVAVKTAYSWTDKSPWYEVQDHRPAA